MNLKLAKDIGIFELVENMFMIDNGSWGKEIADVVTLAYHLAHPKVQCKQVFIKNVDHCIFLVMDKDGKPGFIIDVVGVAVSIYEAYKIPEVFMSFLFD